MKVKELIKALEMMPPDSCVLHLWDGCLRTEIECVWLTRDGRVGTSDYGEYCHDEDDVPFDVILENRHMWRSPDKENS